MAGFGYWSIVAASFFIFGAVIFGHLETPVFLEPHDHCYFQNKGACLPTSQLCQFHPDTLFFRTSNAYERHFAKLAVKTVFGKSNGNLRICGHDDNIVEYCLIECVESKFRLYFPHFLKFILAVRLLQTVMLFLDAFIPSETFNVSLNRLQFCALLAGLCSFYLALYIPFVKAAIWIDPFRAGLAPIYLVVLLLIPIFIHITMEIDNFKDEFAHRHPTFANSYGYANIYKLNFVLEESFFTYLLVAIVSLLVPSFGLSYKRCSIINCMLFLVRLTIDTVMREKLRTRPFPMFHFLIYTFCIQSANTWMGINKNALGVDGQLLVIIYRLETLRFLLWLVFCSARSLHNVLYPFVCTIRRQEQVAAEI